MMSSVCNKCKKEKPKKYKKLYIHGRSKYVDELGRSWNGFTCPDCVNLSQAEYRKKQGQESLTTSNCQSCDVKFEQKRWGQKFCSSKCKKRHYRKLNRRSYPEFL